MRKFVSLLCFCLMFLFFSVANAQSRDDLELQKKKIQEEIDYTNRVLQETMKNKNASMKELNALNSQIRARERLINNVNSQLRNLDNNISQQQNTIKSLENQIIDLKKEYAAMIRFASRNKASYNTLMFIFAAENFNQAYKRMKYIQQFNNYRRKQVTTIENNQRIIAQKIQELDKAKQEKTGLLTEEQKQRNLLNRSKTSQQRVVNNLQSQESRLKKQLQDKQREAQRLTRAIEDIIKREIEEARKKAEADAIARGEIPPTRQAGSTGLALTPEAIKLSADFLGNKGKFPWPVERGFIVQRFGRHPHPVLKNVFTQNNGVNIKTDNAAQVRAVFAGEVAGVINVPGGNLGVLVKHGEYFTVYYNLRSVTVKRGDKISTKQVVGVVATDAAEGVTEVHFEVWKGTTKLDPEDWLFAN